MTITVASKRYEDHDDCLAAAEREVCSRLRLDGWALDSRWSDDQREAILLTVPDHKARGCKNAGYQEVQV